MVRDDTMITTIVRPSRMMDANYGPPVLCVERRSNNSESQTTQDNNSPTPTPAKHP